MDASQARSLLGDMFAAAIGSADPARVLARHLPERPRGRVVVVGAGKAAATMAQAVEAGWPDADLSGVVVTRDGHAVPTTRITVLEAAHPVPDPRSEDAATRILDAVRGLGPDDLVLALISGGGSALMTRPVEGVTLADKVAMNRRLLAMGAPIGVMNQVRRRLSAVKGGKLAQAAAPARVVTLAISDVPGDDPGTIASGPTVPDRTAGADLSDIVRDLGPDLPEAARRALLAPSAPVEFVTDYRLIATPMMALKAAAAVAERAGVRPLILGDALEGEAREMGRILAGIAQSCRAHGRPHPPPVVLLSGGETTVTLRTDRPGRGGRNMECALALALALDGAPGVHALLADTDGIDGSGEAAGATLGPDTLARATAMGLDAGAMLRGHDSETLFGALDDLMRTGPTRTNVNDFRAVLIT
ncbi:glycerate kinase type-2 family protein [Falsirhodobacter sp. 20TX0035]|uniref:glycerate kinase type-2 family protein n=1 Tax=Falsirhodobacter sp. 20TX0035 TaxID=3022019 RepID=UPI00232E7712|nr:glycerate kinase [Falsirhodobacter sp. 20TX0035]MDB6454521.1 glycerate kinase [Falsirhodobacter sp. 20TX0035]